jgi:hypothetical protein
MCTNEAAMLTTRYPFLLPRFLEPDLPEKLRDLADDIERIRAAAAPTELQLERAPIIQGWHTVTTAAGVRLVGRVTGHPELGSAIAMTSQIWVADESRGWMRSLSRFYRLEAPAPVANDADPEAPADV